MSTMPVPHKTGPEEIPDSTARALDEHEGKRIMVLFGSRSDTKNERIMEKIERGRQGLNIDIIVEVASADRLPEIIPAVVNHHVPDGIIASGAYSLPLAGAVAKAIDMLIRSERIADPREALKKFYQGNDLRRRAPAADLFAIIAHSNYFGMERYVPVLAAPLKDSKSGGLSAYISVTEHPSFTDVRPSVGIDNLDYAIRNMHKMLSTGFDKIFVGPEKEEGAKKVMDALEKLGINACIGQLSEGSPMSHNTLQILIYNHNELQHIAYANKAAENSNNLFIAVPVEDEKRVSLLQEKKMWKTGYASVDFEAIMSYVMHYSNGIYVGIGAFDNAAILAAEIFSLSNPDKVDRGLIREMINKRTKEGMGW